VRRREFITLIGGAAAAWPLAARAQQPDRIRRIGVLMGWPESDREAQSELASFVQELQKLGWAEGRNLQTDTRWATPADPESMHRFAKELVALQPELILSQGTPATCGTAAANAHHPHRFRDCCRSDRQRLRRELPAAWRQRYRFRRYGADAGWQVGGTTQGDCAEGHPGRGFIQPRNGDIYRVLAEAVQSRRCVLRTGGGTCTCPRYVGTVRHCRTGSRTEQGPLRVAGCLHDHLSS